MTGILVLVAIAILIGVVMAKADQVAVLLKRAAREMEFRAFKNKREAALEARLRRAFDKEYEARETALAEVMLYGESGQCCSDPGAHAPLCEHVEDPHATECEHGC